MSEISELEAQTLKSHEMREFANTIPQVTILNKEFAIHSDVYHPSISLDMTEYISEVLDKTIEEELAKLSSFDFLEVGCGAGYTSVLVALASDKCRVWAADINEAAVANAKQNSKLHGVEHKVKAVVADVFNNEEINGRKFDMIYWNLPWTGQSTDKDAKVETLLYSVLDPGYRSFMRFLQEAGNFLKEQGRLIVAFSFSLGSEELFRSIASKTEAAKHMNCDLNCVI
ncbi:putative protein methyltransferase MJ0928 [Exaiptasia diaphana]|nr:putative protein methyltransferase MJ0928 [Exaiptasia diaphana]